LKHASEVYCALACKFREASKYFGGRIARHFDWKLLAIDGGLTLILLLFSAFIFRRVEDSFADVI
jgi:ABC-type polysaccharide/polyol phosphate export permease